jgi:hypothetical protein
MPPAGPASAGPASRGQHPVDRLGGEDLVDDKASGAGDPRALAEQAGDDEQLPGGQRLGALVEPLPSYSFPYTAPAPTLAVATATRQPGWLYTPSTSGSQSTGSATPGATSASSPQQPGPRLFNVEEFATLLEAQVVVEAWRIAYNAYRPHSSLGDMTPVEYAASWTSINQPAL